MEIEYFRKFLTERLRVFNGFSPMGVLEGAGEEGYISNINNLQTHFNIEEIIESYFNALETQEQFTNYEHLWVLEQIGLNRELLDKFTVRHLRILTDLYLSAITTNMSCRIFIMMLLMVLDQKLPDNKSFIAYLFKRSSETNNERLSQRDTLIDVINVMTDLGAISHHDKSLKILVIMSDQRELNYVREQVFRIASVYGEEVIQALKQWLTLDKNKGN